MVIPPEEVVILIRVLGAVVVGALIGFERSFHGRPAGFRTHALVCVASSLLMLVTVYQNQWMTVVPLDSIRTLLGDEVANLLEGVQRLARIRWDRIEEEAAETLRKMFLAMAHDVRVVLIVLAIRVQLMRSLRESPRFSNSSSFSSRKASNFCRSSKSRIRPTRNQ